MRNETEILEKKQSGDIKTVALMIGRTTETCRTALSQKKGKVYEEVLQALDAVIRNREDMINGYSK